MDVILTEVENGKSKFIFPSLPEEVKGTNRTNYQSYDILSCGEVKIPKGMKLTEVSFDGIFFGEAKKNESIVKQWVKPTECEKILKYWQEKGTVLRLMVTETNINIDVTISRFECTDYGGYGNKKYSVEFVQYRSLKVYTTDELKIVKFVKKTVTRPAAAAPSNKGSYTVKQGNTLWSIARKFYGGSGTAWTKIYNANKSVIESTAKKHGYANSDNGHWIFPGTVLVIPN